MTRDEHLAAMHSNLRMAEDATRAGLYGSASRFHQLAGAHAAIATALGEPETVIALEGQGRHHVGWYRRPPEGGTQMTQGVLKPYGQGWVKLWAEVAP